MPVVILTLSSPQPFPSGVTLQAIDGGPTYYADNGFTNAVSAGFDGSIFPVYLFLPRMDNATDAANWVDLNVTGSIELQSDSGPNALSRMRTNGLVCVPQANELATILANNGGSLGTESVGIEALDEPATVAAAQNGIINTPNVSQDNRFWYENYTWNQLAFGDVGGTNMPTLLSTLVTTPNATQRHFNLASTDIYWMAGDNGADGGAYNSGTLYGQGSVLTSDQRRRGARYGDQIDWQRLGSIPIAQPWQVGHFPAPMAVYIETGGPYAEDTSQTFYIQPPELNAAAWSTIIHGARFIEYFIHTFAGPGSGNTPVSGTYFTTLQGSQTITIYNQMKATNGLIKTMGTVLNSPFALGYATVSPAGWKFGDAPITFANAFTGFEIMTKYSGGSFYIFAMPRYSQATTNQTATFTIKYHGASSVTVINESRSLPITAGTTFTDTFATGNTVHIYKIV